jgi:hypothetical protein
MKKFLVLYRMNMAVMSTMMSENPELAKKGQEEWGVWMKNHMADFADPGGPVGKNTQVGAGGATEASNDIAGYTIFKAESKEALLKLLADNPHFTMPEATADVMEVFDMGM